MKEQGYYQDLLVYEVAKVRDFATKYYIEYVTVSTMPWVTGETNLLPLNSLAANVIREAQLNGKEVYIKKNWGEIAKEVLITDLEINPITNLEAYKRRAYTFIKSFINPMMASVHASVVFGFTMLNNKFIERGYVFSEATRTLKYIDIMEKTEELEETNPTESVELMEDLEKYIEYKEILSRANFIWNASERYIDKIEKIKEDSSNQESQIEAKIKVDELCKEFQNKINNLNNLK